MPAKRICLLAVIALTITTVIVCARPFWCPDLTNDDFVNFPDFAVQANYWRQTGDLLPGDFFFNDAVDINDFAYLAFWWLHDCYDPPPDFCPDCNYPDCNVTECNIPPTPIPCPYCDTTPPFIKVTIRDSINCAPECISNEPGPHSFRQYGNLDGTWIVPSSYPYAPCMWTGTYKHNPPMIVRLFENEDCTGNTNDLVWDYVTIVVYRYDVGLELHLGAYGEGVSQEELLSLFWSNSELVNCIEAGAKWNQFYPDCGSGVMWGGGYASIQLVPRQE